MWPLRLSRPESVKLISSFRLGASSSRGKIYNFSTTNTPNVRTFFTENFPSRLPERIQATRLLYQQSVNLQLLPSNSLPPSFCYKIWITFKISGVYLGFDPAVVVNDPDLIKNIMIRDFEYFVDRGIYKSDKQPITVNIFSQNGIAWRNIRVGLFSDT